MQLADLRRALYLKTPAAAQRARQLHEPGPLVAAGRYAHVLAARSGSFRPELQAESACGCVRLTAALVALERDSAVRGVIIASGVKKDIFTAGCVSLAACRHDEGSDSCHPRARNDLTELYAKATTKERYTKFWFAQTHCLVRPAAP